MIWSLWALPCLQPVPCRPGPVFCLLLRVSSGCALPITGQVTSVTWPVIGWALSELTPSKRQKIGPGLQRTGCKQGYTLCRLICLPGSVAEKGVAWGAEIMTFQKNLLSNFPSQCNFVSNFCISWDVIFQFTVWTVFPLYPQKHNVPKIMHMSYFL